MAENRDESSGKGEGKASPRRLPQPRARFSAEHRALLSILVEARQAAGLSQAALAEKLGKVQSHIAYIETNDRDITVVETYRWCEATRLPFVEFARLLDERIRALRMQPPE